MQTDKKIVHLNFAKGYRGGERQTQLLIEALAARGYRQKIITRENSTLAQRLERVENLEIVRIKKPYIFSLYKLKDVSLLHAHETKAAQVTYFAHLFYKLPYIITRRVDNPIKQNFFNQAIYTHAYKTVVLSHAIKAETLKVDANIHTQIIPSAYTSLEVNPDNVTQIKKRFHDKFLIGNIGELENQHKGQHYLIEAMKKLQKSHPNIHLILLGKGKDKEQYQEQAKDLDNITFEGFVDNVGDYIASLELFVFPSLNEGLGSILLDVIQAKVPIIASDVGGIPDIIEHEHTGILIEPKNADAIYQAIVKLYNDPAQRKNLANEAYKTIENYSIESMTDKYEALYKPYLEKGRLDD